MAEIGERQNVRKKLSAQHVCLWVELSPLAPAVFLFFLFVLILCDCVRARQCVSIVCERARERSVAGAIPQVSDI